MANGLKQLARWRRLRRALVAVGLLIALLIAIPFFFTASLTRWALRRTDYERFAPTLRSASLSLGGQLVINDLELREPAPRGDKLLVKAGQIRATFSWHQVFQKRLRVIDAKDVTVFLRPGEPNPQAKQPWANVTLLDLFNSGSASPPDQRAAPAPTAHPFWYDTLNLTGHLESEPFTEFHAAGTSFPFQFMSHMRGNPSSPTRDFSLKAGDDPAHGQLAAQLLVEPTPTGSRITLQHLTAQAIGGTVTEPYLKQLLATAPEALRQNLDATISSINATATIDRSPTNTAIKGQLDIRGISISSQPSTKHNLHLNNLNFTATIETPFGADFLHAAALNQSQLTFDSLSYGKSEFQHFSTPLVINDGTLLADAVKVSFAKGDFSGSVGYSLAHRKLEKAALKVEHLDQKEVAANLAPDKLDAEGTTSGTINLAADSTGTLTGAIDLLADGPGKLQIKDQQAAEAIAQKLQTGAAAGVLPANFSTIVVQQLRDYPYKTGHLNIDAPDGVPVITLNYARDPIQAGDPGYGIKTTIGGQPVLANYTIQLPALSIVLQGKSIAELLGLGTGFENQIARDPDKK